MAAEFAGFGAKTLSFLRELEANNNQTWFQANKSRYEEGVLAPALAYISAMAPMLARLAPGFEAVPKRMGGSLMRVYRDTRFAKDKSPYKTNIGIQLRHRGGKDVHAPGYYLHVAPGELFFGVGCWHPEPEALAKIRQRIADEPAVWKRARDAKPFRARFELAGDQLVRVPRGFPVDHRCADDLRRKDFLGIARLGAREVAKPALVDSTAELVKAASPLMRFLCAALEVPY